MSNTFDQALAAHQAGNLSRAEQLYREILATESQHFDAVHLLGVIHAQRGQFPEAARLIEQALSVQPDNPEALYNLGNALLSMGRPEDALACFDKVLASCPRHADAHNNRGNVLRDLKRLEEAVASYRAAVALKPNYAEAHNNLGNVLNLLGRSDEAAASYRKAVALKPDFAEAHNNLGIVLNILGRLDEATASYRKALALEPDFAEAHNNLGNALNDLGQPKEAIASYRKALALEPDFAEAHNNLGNVLKHRGRSDEAAASYRKAVALKPDYAEAHNNLGNVLIALGRLDEATASYRTAMALKPDYAEAHSNLLFAMNYDDRYSQEDIFTESRRWDAAHGVPKSGRVKCHANNQDPERRLRVGYVSPDFREHSVSYFLSPLIAGHDRSRFEVFCYAEVANPGDTTARFRGLSDGWYSTVGEKDAAVAEKIQADGIDILVDLAGHTAKNRLRVFAHGPAPVQVTWLGYPNTTGLSTMDYRLTDAIADPEGADDALFSETLVRLPEGFLCYAPPDDAPEVTGLPALDCGRVTFASFNNLSKATPRVIEVWARILDAVPGSRLIIKSRSLADEKTRARYLQMFSNYGTDNRRLELLSRIPSRSEHLSAYGQVDIGLDPFPYNGTTTTCEAMWMGVPVITLSGNRHSGRVGASILTRVGLTELITETMATYVEAAVELANDRDRLSVLRQGLRRQLQGSPLCDGAAFTRQMEAAYRDMWRKWCEGPQAAGP